MNKRNILIVSNAFYPENSPRSFRTTELVKEFCRQGHEVTIITHEHPSQKPLKEEFGYQIKDLGNRKWKRIQLDGSGFILLIKRVLSRFLGLLFEYPDIQLVRMVKKALKNESGYDLLISVAVPYPVHWGVAWARTKKHPIAKVWVADCGDPYMGRENDTFNAPFYFKYVEKWFSKKADYLTVPVKGAIEAYYPQFNSKIRVIPQGFKFEDYQYPAADKKEKYPTFMYAGDLIPGRRDPKEFLDFLLEQEGPFKFYVFTRKKEMIEPYSRKSNGRIIWKEPVPRQKLMGELSKVDFAVNFDNVGTRQRPSKLIDYAILNKPVLSIKTGILDEKAAKEFLNGIYTSAVKFDNIDQYRIENVTKAFLSLISKNGKK